MEGETERGSERQRQRERDIERDTAVTKEREQTSSHSKPQQV